MPLRLLKKTRKYEVSSKNSYVVCVNLLDNHLIECTLTAESTGYECLHNIAQRIELNELSYFGLRYVNRKLQLRWVELERPLKKQLDKNAHSPLLYFGVMHYLPDAHRIQDDLARYQYYLQLKSDVTEGKLICATEKAVLLAAYSVQAELGDHNPAKHTAEFLREATLLPRNLTTDDRVLTDLIQEIINTHQQLHGITPPNAEMEYILEAQQLENYGLDYFSAKDPSNNEVLLGASFIGVFVKPPQRSTVYYKWETIDHLTVNKKTFGIKSTLSEKAVFYQLDDPDTAKYVHKICALQHKFYRARIGAPDSCGPTFPMSPTTPDTSDVTDSSLEVSPLSKSSKGNSQMDTSDSSYQGHMGENRVTKPCEDTASPSNNVQTSMLTPVSSSYSIEEEFPVATQAVTDSNSKVVGSLPDVYPQGIVIASDQPLAPSYRHTPDYDAVMQSRKERDDPKLEYIPASQSQQQHQRPAHSHPDDVYTTEAGTVYTTEEMSELAQQQTQQYLEDVTSSLASGSQNPSAPHSALHGAAFPKYSYYPDLSVTNNNVTNSEGFPLSHPHHPLRPVDRTSSLIIYPTQSTPELHRFDPPGYTSTSENTLNVDYVYNYRPPPPYPRLASSSTPDLASPTHSRPAKHPRSPDLISHRTLQAQPLSVQSYLDQSVENLTLDTHRLHLNQQLACCSRGQNDDTSSISSEQPSSSTPTPSLTTNMMSLSQSSIPDVASHTLTTPVMLSHDIVKHTPQHPIVTPTSSLGTSHAPTSLHSSFSSGTGSPATGSFRHSQSDSKEGTPAPVLRAKQSDAEDVDVKRLSMGALKMAAMNGLALARGSVLEVSCDLEPQEVLSAPETRVPKDERRQLLESKLEEGQVFVEFEQIPKKRLKYEVMAAQQPQNKDRNRFKDVLPYDDNRVKLTSSKENPMGYVNASYVQVKVCNDWMRYIASQGPLPNTTPDFWQLVWEQQVEVVAMLTGLQEHGRQKCQCYWPEHKGHRGKIQCGNYQIMMRFMSSAGPYVTRGLLVRHLPSNKERLVWHLQYTDWPDHGCPEDVDGFMAYLDEIEGVQRQLQAEKGLEPGSAPPILVHCSAGVGRTGVVILSQIMRACLEHNQAVEIAAMLLELREQRMHMVQTVSQYSFVYKTLIHFLKGARLI